MARPAYRDRITEGITFLLNRNGSRRAIGKKYLLEVLSLITPTIEVQSNGLRFFVDTKDFGVGLHVFVEGGFDSQIMDDIIKILEYETGGRLTGKSFVDIGANIGTTTATAIKRYGASQVIAFEPEPRNFGLLGLVIRANALEDHVQVHQIALSDYKGTATMELSPVNTGDHRLRKSVREGHWGEQERDCIDVAVTTFDNTDTDLTDVSVVWMDVQGHEGQVLAGATRLLQTTIPIVTEYCPYMLERADGLKMFHRLVEEKFVRIVDCHTGQRLLASEVSTLAARYPRPADFTDLLLLHTGTGVQSHN